MNKVYLNVGDTYEKALENCNSFRELVWGFTWEAQMFLREDYIANLGIEGLEYHNQYNSSYCTIEDPEKFLDSFRRRFSYYLNTQDKDMLEDFVSTFEIFNQMDHDEDQYDDLKSYIEEKCEYFKNLYENSIHSYEDLDEIEALMHDGVISENFEYYYIKDNDYTKVYLDICDTTEVYN